MENQQVNAQENAVQQHEGQVEGFGQHPLDGGGMSDGGVGSPPMAPPPLDLGGESVGSPIVRTLSPNFSISESGKEQAGSFQSVAQKQASTDPFQGESGMARTAEAQSASGESEAATALNSQFDSFKASINTNYGELMTVESLDAFITNLRTAVQAANDPVYDFPFIGFDPDIDLALRPETDLELISNVQLERGPVDTILTGEELIKWYPDERYPLPPAPIDLAPMELEISEFKGHFEYLFANLRDLNSTVTSSSWEDTMLLWMRGCEISATESRNAFIRLDNWVRDNFLSSVLFPIDPWGPIAWKPVDSVPDISFEGDYISPLYPGLGFPGDGKEAIRASLDAFTPLENQMLGISNDGTDDEIQALIDRDTPENRTKRIEFRDHAKTTYGLDFDLIDLIFDHLIENEIDPADHNAYQFVTGETGDIQGSSGVDIIIADPGTTSVDALGGDDFIYSSDDGAVVFSGAGNDTVYLEGNNTVVDGGTGSDTVNTNGSGTTVIDRENQDQISGLSDGESSLGSYEDLQGEANRDSEFGQAKWGLIDQFGSVPQYDFFEGQFQGFVETLSYELYLKEEATNSLNRAQSMQHFQQGIQAAMAQQAMSNMASMLLLGTQVPIVAQGASDFFRLTSIGSAGISDLLTLRMYNAMGVPATQVAAQSLEQQDGPPPIDQRLGVLQGYMDEFNSLYQGLMNQMTLIQLVPFTSNWEEEIITPINDAITGIAALQSQFDLIKGAPGTLEITTLNDGETIRDTYELLYKSIEDVVVSGLGGSLGTEQTKIQGMLDKDSDAQRSLRRDFRDQTLASYDIDFDTSDIIFDFLIENDLTPLGDDYAIRIPIDGVIQGDGEVDILVGGDGDDVIHGGGGNDLILGRGGDDQINGGGGSDTIYGGDGNDHIEGGDELALGEEDHDIIYGGDGHDIVKGGVGNDILHGGDGNDILIGGDDNDTFHGNGGEDLIHHEAGELHNAGEGEAVLDGIDHNPASGNVGLVDLTQGTISVTSEEAIEIAAAGTDGLSVTASLGSRFEEVSIPIVSTNGVLHTHANANVFAKAIDHPMTTIFGTFLDFGVQITIVDGAPIIVAETRLAGTEVALSPDNLDTILQQAGLDLGGMDFGLGDTGLNGIVFLNNYHDGALDFQLNFLPIKIGEYVQGTASIGYVNWEFIFDGDLTFNLGDGMTGALTLGYDGDQLFGTAVVDVNFGDVSGYINIYYNSNGVTGLAGEGVGIINTEKFSAEVDFFFGPSDWVKEEVDAKVAEFGLSSPDGVGSQTPTGESSAGPDISTINSEETDNLSWAGIVSGKVPIKDNFEANAHGILDSDGDYAMSLSLNQTGDIPLTDPHSGNWGLSEDYPVVDFGIPLVADISANAIVGFDFKYDFKPITLSGGELTGTYAKPGNKYNIGNTLDLKGTISMEDDLELEGTLGMGLEEHVLTQRGKIVVQATVAAIIKGKSTAQADLRGELDDDGFHPHFDIVVDLSQDLSVDLGGTFYAENRIKHWFRGDSVQKVEIDLGGATIPIGHMDLEMGYNSDAEKNKFSFGPPEGQGSIFQLNSIEDMIEKMHTRGPEVVDYGWEEPDPKEGDYDFDADPSQEHELDDLSEFDISDLDDLITSLTNDIDKEVDKHVDQTDQRQFTPPSYSEETHLSEQERKIKIVRVLRGLLDLYKHYYRYDDADLTVKVLEGMISQIKNGHDVFTSLHLVKGENTSGEATYGVANPSEYYYWEWTASDPVKAPASKKQKLESDDTREYGTGWVDGKKMVNYGGVNQEVNYEDAARIYEQGTPGSSGTVYRAIDTTIKHLQNQGSDSLLDNLPNPVEPVGANSPSLPNNSKGVLKHIGSPYGKFFSTSKSQARVSVYASKSWNGSTVDAGRMRKADYWRPILTISISRAVSGSSPIYDMTDEATKAAILAIEVDLNNPTGDFNAVIANAVLDEEVVFTHKIDKSAVDSVEGDRDTISQNAYGNGQVPGYKLKVSKDIVGSDFVEGEKLTVNDLRSYDTEIVSKVNRPDVCKTLMELDGRRSSGDTSGTFEGNRETFLSETVAELTAFKRRTQKVMIKEEYDALKALIEWNPSSGGS